MKKLFESIALVGVGLAIVICSLYFFMYVRTFLFSFEFVAIFLTCLVLICIILKPHYIVRMKISNMKLDTAQHYYFIIIVIIIGFSALVAVAITLLWQSEGDLYRTYSCLFFVVLLIYFIIVMYLVFLRELSFRVAKLNYNE